MCLCFGGLVTAQADSSKVADIREAGRMGDELKLSVIAVLAHAAQNLKIMLMQELRKVYSWREWYTT